MQNKIRIRLSAVSEEIFLPTDVINEDILDKFSKFFIKGNLNINLSVNNHPSGTLNGIAFAEDKFKILEIFAPNTYFDVLSFGLAIKSLNFTELAYTYEGARLLEVNIHLTGKWEFLLQKNHFIFLKRIHSNSFCERSSQSTNNQKITSCAEISDNLGIPLFLPSPWIIKTSDNTYTNLEALLREQAPYHKCILHFYHKDKVFATKLLESQEHIIQESDILSNINSNPRQNSFCRNELNIENIDKPKIVDFHGNLITPEEHYIVEPPIPLSKYYYPMCPLNFNYKILKNTINVSFTMGEEFSNSLNLHYLDYDLPKEKKWKKTDYIYFLEQGNVDPEKPPLGADFIDSISVNHNEKKTIERTFYKNGSPIKSIKRIFSFEIYGQDLFYFDYTEERWKSRKVSASPYWRLIEESISYYIYTPPYYYLNKVITFTKTRVRFREESTNLPETAILFVFNYDRFSPEELSNFISPIVNQIPPELIIEARVGLIDYYLMYLYQWLEVITVNCRELEAKDRYFPEKAEIIQKRTICLPNGTSRTIYENDPNKVPEYFIKREITISSGKLRCINPDYIMLNAVRNLWDSEQALPLIPEYVETGTHSKSERVIDIIKQNQVYYGEMDSSAYMTHTNYYKEFNYRYASKGENFKDFYLQEVTFNTNIGEPPTAERLNENWQEIIDEEHQKDNEYTWYVQSENVPDCLKIYYNFELNNTSIHSEYSHTVHRHVGETINCDKALTFQQVKNFAYYSLFFDNLDSESFDIFFNKNIFPGDILIIYANRFIRKRFVHSVSHHFEFEGLFGDIGKKVITGKTSLTVSSIPDIKLKFFKQKNPKNPPPEEPDKKYNLGVIGCEIDPLLWKNIGRYNL